MPAAQAAKAAAGKGTVTSVDLNEDGTSGPAKGWDVETQSSGKGEQAWNVGLQSAKVTADRAGDHADDNTRQRHRRR